MTDKGWAVFAELGEGVEWSGVWVCVTQYKELRSGQGSVNSRRGWLWLKALVSWVCEDD